MADISKLRLPGKGEVYNIKDANAAPQATTYTKTEVDSAIQSALSSVLKYKGTKATLAEIQAIAPATRGDFWLCAADNSEYVAKESITVATPSNWEKLGVTIDISGKEDKSNKVTSWSATITDTNYPSEKLVKDSLDAKSSVSVSATGTAIDTVQYITINGIEKRLAGGGSVPGAVENDIATFNSSGSIKDSGIDSTKLVVTSDDVPSTEVSSAELTSNKVTVLSTSSTNVQYPSAKCVYDALATAGSKNHAELDNLSYAASGHTGFQAEISDLSAIRSGAALGTSISEKVPNEATSTNKLADKEFVNSSISTNTAHYISNNGEPFTSVAQLEAYAGIVTNNDYAFVTGTDSEGNSYFDRYKATVEDEIITWAKEYRLNNSSFTAAQWASITSGITANKVSIYDGYASTIATKISDAPSDSKQYARQNGSWTEVSATGGGIVVSSSAPAGDSSKLWIDTENGGIAKYWNGTMWTTVKSVWG